MAKDDKEILDIAANFLQDYIRNNEVDFTYIAEKADESDFDLTEEDTNKVFDLLNQAHRNMTIPSPN